MWVKDTYRIMPFLRHKFLSVIVTTGEKCIPYLKLSRKSIYRKYFYTELE